MPSRKAVPPEPGAAATPDESAPTGSLGALSALEQAEAEAARAEAEAAAARTRAREIRLRSEAEAAAIAQAPETAEPEDAATRGDHEPALAEESEPHATEVESDIAVRPRRIWRALRWAASVVAVLVIGALIAASVMMVIHHRDVQAQQRWAAEFEAAARQGVVTLMSLDYNHAADDVKQIIDNATGDFKEDFENESENFIKTAQEAKVVTEATVASAAVESMTESDAVVLLAATSKVTNSAGARQEPRNWRLAVNMVRDGDRIKMSKVEFVP